MREADEFRELLAEITVHGFDVGEVKGWLVDAIAALEAKDQRISDLEDRLALLAEAHGV